MSTMTIELEPGLVTGLNRLAERLADSPAHIAQQAIQQFVELNEWQINEIEAALIQADADDFASDDQVKAVFSKWS
ncbi:MAG: CopG family ribbon-helix-helix protein [Hydrogenovibrio sp.]